MESKTTTTTTTATTIVLLMTISSTLVAFLPYVVWWKYVSKKRHLPKRIILLRHGQSEGNVNPEIYRQVPDSSLHLTELGRLQAEASGKQIHGIVRDETVRFIISPYIRTMESYRFVAASWGKEAAKDFPWSEEPRIREQDFGNFQDPDQIRTCKVQRKRFGSFFYRFPSGESPADVYDRVSSFLESLHRSFRRYPEQNYVLITHGVAIRVLLMRYFRYTIRDFEKLENFSNGEFVVLHRSDREGRFEIERVARPIVNDSTKEVVFEQSDTVRVRSRVTEMPCCSPIAAHGQLPIHW